MVMSVTISAADTPWWQRGNPSEPPPEAEMDSWPVIDPRTISAEECLKAGAAVRSEACLKYFLGAVVQVATEEDSKGEPTSWGSGFFIDKELVVTNWHVVKGLNLGQEVTLRWLFRPGPGMAPPRGKAVVAAKNFYRDLAILKLKEPRFSAFLQLESDPGNMKGMNVAAIGFPARYIKRAEFVTEGQVMAYPVSANVDQYWPRSLVSISATIFGGNSGGPLISRDSKKVVGVICSRYGDGYNEAVPVDSLRHFLGRFKKGKPTASGWLGMEKSAWYEETLKIAGKEIPGLKILKVKAPAASAKDYKDAPLGPYDENAWIVAINGQDIKALKAWAQQYGDKRIYTPAQAVALFSMQYFEGDRLLLTLYNGGRLVERPTGLLARPDSPPWVFTSQP